MNIALTKPWTVEQFFAWAASQAGRYEFDGIRPVAMTGGTVNHGIIMRNLHRALDARLRGSACQPLGPDVGVKTVGEAVRYPDAIVTCTKLVGTAHTVPGAVVVFEIVSPTSGNVDRIVKVREYAAIDTTRRYVLIESASVGLLCLHRSNAGEAWTALPLTEDGNLAMPEIGVQIPVAELYVDIDPAGLAAG
jgi:Uma2 family endonuclease